MKYLKNEKQATRFYFIIHTDETKVLDRARAAELNLPVGVPDPAYVREFEWLITPPEGKTELQYIDMMKSEMALHVAESLKLAPAPITLAGF